LKGFTVRHPSYLAAACALALAAIWPGHPAQAQQGPHKTAVRIIRIGTGTRVLDMGTEPGMRKPAHWQAVSFNDGKWSRTAALQPAFLACVIQSHRAVAAWKTQRAYWGGIQDDYYLFRQSFTAPRAKSYHGSTLVIGAAARAQVYMNGHLVHVHDTRFGTTRIGRYLRAGRNVLALAVDHAANRTSSGFRCSALSFTITLRSTI
jgi:hypothetical protein